MSLVKPAKIVYDTVIRATARKGGHEDETDLERAAACKLPLWANVWGTGRRIHRDLYDALLCTNVYADGALNRSKRK